MLKLLPKTMVCPNNHACAAAMPVAWSLEPDVEAGNRLKASSTMFLPESSSIQSKRSIIHSFY